MIGFYDYTVILTYCSVISAVAGILLSLNASPHPYIAIFLLMFSGLCDAFDGKVARHKKNRTKAMKEFGIQIDSLSDLAAFGVLPVCIGAALRRVGPDAFQLPFLLTATVSCLYVWPTSTSRRRSFRAAARKSGSSTPASPSPPPP